MSDAGRCSATRKDGQPCSLNALPGRTACFAHAPENDADRAKGGRNKATTVRANKALLARLPDGLGDIHALVLKAIADAESGVLPPARAQAIAALVGALMRVHDGAMFSTRLDDIEARLPEEQDRRYRVTR